MHTLARLPCVRFPLGPTAALQPPLLSGVPVLFLHPKLRHRGPKVPREKALEAEAGWMEMLEGM